MTALAQALSLLVDAQPTLHVLNFSLNRLETEDWELIEVLPGFNGPDGSVDIFLFQNKHHPAQVIRYEVIETGSEPAADQATRSLLNRDMTAHRLGEIGLEDRTHASDLVQGARLAFVDASETGFQSLSLAYANLAYRLESIGDEDAEIEDLGVLKPNRFFQMVLNGERSTEIQVDLHQHPDAGPGIALALDQVTGKHEPLWYILLADTDLVRFSRQKGVVRVLPDSNPAPATADIYAVWVDRDLRHGIAGPLTLDFSR